MRWPMSSRTSMWCWRRWQLGWKTTDVARRRGRFWWRFRTLAVESGRATATSDRVPTAALGQQWGGEPWTGRAREARGGFGPRPDRGGALMAWCTRGGRGRSSAPGGRRHPTSGPGTGLRAPHVSGFQFSEKLKNLFPHKKNRYKVRKNLEKIKEVVNTIWNTFCDYNFLRFFTNFELF
jgi:hypothetical protein